MSVELRDVSVTLGGQTVLEDVSLTARSGRLLGLIGPNGAGKTTLLNTIKGIGQPTAGVVRVDGDDVADLGARALSRRVASVPQDTHLEFAFTVREVVELGRHPHRNWYPFDRSEPADAPVHDAMARTDVTHLAERSITTVSGGERQRVLLARALAQDTPALLLDEPTASLDVANAVRTLEMARTLARDGKTVIAAIHDLNLAARYCDRIALLGEGRVLGHGTPESVFEADRLRAAFGGDIVVSRDPITAAPMVRALAREDRPDRGSRAQVHLVGGDRTIAAVIAALRSAGYHITVGMVPDDGLASAAAESQGCEAVTVDPEHATAVDVESVRAKLTEADAVVVAPTLDEEPQPPELGLLSLADRVVRLDRPESDPAGPLSTDPPNVYRGAPRTVVRDVAAALATPGEDETDTGGGLAVGRSD